MRAARTKIVAAPADARRYAVLQHAVREHELCEIFKALRAAGIEPILLKGWSVARHYPDPAARPLGDIDLSVRPEDLPKAAQSATGEIDWHKHDTLPPGAVDRSIEVPLEDTRIRILCPEHNLHYVAIHMLRHAAWSPEWLQDVEVLVETRRPDFDWNQCEGQDKIEADWVRSALVIAHELRGTNIENTPAQNHQLPGWVIPAIKKKWRNQDFGSNQPPEGIEAAIKKPWRLPKALKDRWPNPLTATIKTHSAIATNSPLPAQLTYCRNLLSKKRAEKWGQGTIFAR